MNIYSKHFEYKIYAVNQWFMMPYFMFCTFAIAITDFSFQNG